MDPKKLEACAEAAHEANRIYCAAIGDTSVPRWHEASEEHRASIIRGVKVALGGTTPEQQHEAWMADKIRDGWIYGPTKNATAKTHPCLVPYAALPAEQRTKDSLYIGVVRGMAASLGMVVHYPALPDHPAHAINWSTGDDTVENDRFTVCRGKSGEPSKPDLYAVYLAATCSRYPGFSMDDPSVLLAYKLGQLHAGTGLDPSDRASVEGRIAELNGTGRGYNGNAAAAYLKVHDMPSERVSEADRVTWLARAVRALAPESHQSLCDIGDLGPVRTLISERLPHGIDYAGEPLAKVLVRLLGELIVRRAGEEADREDKKP